MNTFRFYPLLAATAISVSGQTIIQDTDCFTEGFTENTPHICFEAFFTETDEFFIPVFQEAAVGVGNGTQPVVFDGFEAFDSGFLPGGITPSTPFNAHYTPSANAGQATDTLSIDLGFTAAIGDSDTPGENQVTIAADSFSLVNVQGPETGFTVDVTYVADGTIGTPTVPNNGFFSLFTEAKLLDMDDNMTPLFSGGGTFFMDADGTAHGTAIVTPIDDNTFDFVDTVVDSLDIPDGEILLGVDNTASGTIFADGFESGDTTAWTTSFGDTFSINLSSSDPGVTFTLVPEPQTYALLTGFVCSGLVYFRRRKA